jgi:hypothetical protein
MPAPTVERIVPGSLEAEQRSPRAMVKIRQEGGAQGVLARAPA